MIIGISLVLMSLVGVMGVINHDRDEERMRRVLLNKGAALIQSLESGLALAPTVPLFQTLPPVMADLVRRPDILGIALTDAKGKIQLHQLNPKVERLSTMGALPSQPHPGAVPQWRIIRQSGEPAYAEVFRGVRLFHADFPTPATLFIAMDIRSFDQAMAADRNHNLVMAAIILALGAAGVVSLFWAQRHARSKALLERAQKMAMVGNLAAGLAHEIRNPLSSIKGYATFFETLFDPNTPPRDAARSMAQEVDRVNRVISELLAFARPTDLKFQTMDLHQVVAHTLGVVAREAETGNISISPPPPSTGTEGHIQADPDRLSQVLLNLYINAIQAMPQGGKLSVDLLPGSRNVRIKVKDTGLGIPRDHLPRIFDPYFTDKAQGTGLGLSVSKNIVETHGGVIQVESRRGQGTCFTISLPIKQKESHP